MVHHSDIDDPNTSEVIVVGRGDDGEMRLEKRPIQPMTDELKAVIEEMK